MTVVMKNWEPTEGKFRDAQMIMTESQTICIFACVGHAKLAFFCVLQLEILVLEFVPVDGLSPCAVSTGKITTLNHELLDNTMEAGAFVAKAFLACCQRTEVLCGLVIYEHNSRSWKWKAAHLWHRVAIETHHNPPEGLAILLNVEIDLVRDLWPLCR